MLGHREDVRTRGRERERAKHREMSSNNKNKITSHVHIYDINLCWTSVYNYTHSRYDLSLNLVGFWAIEVSMSVFSDFNKLPIHNRITELCECVWGACVNLNNNNKNQRHKESFINTVETAICHGSTKLVM